jgi:hypothetical protein
MVHGQTVRAEDLSYFTSTRRGVLDRPSRLVGIEREQLDAIAAVAARRADPVMICEFGAYRASFRRPIGRTSFAEREPSTRRRHFGTCAALARARPPPCPGEFEVPAPRATILQTTRRL